MPQRALICRACEVDEGRRSPAVGVGVGGEPACKRHVVARTLPRTRRGWLARIARADRRARAARLAALGLMRAGIESGAVTLTDVGDELGIARQNVRKYVSRADDAGARP